jgi:hypothetical protein
MPYDKVVDSAKLDGAIKETADAIREKTGTSELIEWDRNNGFKDSVDDIFNAGKKAEHEAFWNSALLGIAVESGTYRFAGSCWNDETFKPNRTITLGNNCNACFYACGITDITENIVFKNITSFSQAFQWSKVKRVPSIDVSNTANLSLAQSFANSELEWIEGLKVSDTTKFSNTFNDASKLVHVIFYGTIAQNGLNLARSTLLDKESITSIINALSTTTSGLSITISTDAVNKAFETAEGANDGVSSQEFLSLLGGKKWTIALS